MKTGINDLDNILKIKEEDFIIIASRPKMGKSTLVQNIIINVAVIENKPTLYFSLEDSKENIVKKLILKTSMIKKEVPIFIDTTIPQTIYEIIEKSHKIKQNKNIELIIIDCLQLIQFDSKKALSRDNEIREILKELKKIAKKLKIPIIVTSQLSRNPEKRKDKRPVITDFANIISSVLRYADKILFIYRDSYYNKENKSNITDIIVVKNEKRIIKDE